MRINKANIPATSLVTGTSRYRASPVVYYGERNIITFETYVRKEYVQSGTENLMLITPGVEYRPDLVSYQKYGTPDYWWFVLQANGMKDIWEFKAGKTIILPDQTSL